MRVSLAVYGVLYVVLEVVGYQLGQIGWTDISALDVATAVTDALLILAVCAAVLVCLDLAVQRRRRSTDTRRPAADESNDEVSGEVWDEASGVTAWRPAPLAVTSERAEPPPTQYEGNPYSFAGHRFPKDPGRLL
jgi:hypothetical protein